MGHVLIKDFINNTQTKEKIIYLFLFLFPIAGPVVRHWNSNLFHLTLLFSLYFLFSKSEKKPLLKEEKIFLLSFGLFFISFIITSVLNGWGEHQTIDLGLELRFLLAVPMYLLVREYEYSLKVLFAGFLFSIPVIFIFSVIEYYIVPGVTPGVITGAYSTLFIGPITALILLFFPAAYKMWFGLKGYLWSSMLYYFMGMFVIVLSYARTGYITIFVGSIFLVLFALKNLKNKMLYFILMVTVIFGLLINEKVNNRIMSASDNIENYITSYNDGSLIKKEHLGSLGIRLEMWRSSQYAIKSHPLFGIGAGNFPEYIEEYIQQGKVNKTMRIAGQLHNSFVEVIVSKGLFGLIILLMLFYYPLYVAWKNRIRCERCFYYTVILSSSFTLMSLGESMLINKDNGTAHFIIFTIVLFSYMMRQLYPDNFKATIQ